MPMTPERVIQIEEELAKIENEIDREIARQRERELKMKHAVKARPITSGPLLLPDD